MADNYTDEMCKEEEVLAAIELKRSQLEQDVVTTEAAWEEAKLRLSTFRASALSALGAASGSKSAQKQRAERRAVVERMLNEGLSRAEIVRRTGLVDHLVGYDIDCIQRRRKKQGEKRVFAKPGDRAAQAAKELGEKPKDPEDDEREEEDEESDEKNAEAENTEIETPKPASSAPPAKVEKPSAPSTPFVNDKPGQPGVVRPGCSASRDQLKSAAKAIQRSGRKTCYFVTTVDNGHSHVVALDLMGDGATLVDNTKHRHRICRFEMLESDHFHGITLEEK